MRRRLTKLMRLLGPPPGTCDCCSEWAWAAQLAWRELGTSPDPCPMCGVRPGVFGPPGDPPRIDPDRLEREARAVAKRLGIAEEEAITEAFRLVGLTKEG